MVTLILDRFISGEKQFKSVNFIFLFFYLYSKTLGKEGNHLGKPKSLSGDTQITIQTKEKSPLSELAGSVSVGKYEDYPDESIGKKSRVPPLTKYEAEKIIKQRGTKCQYPHCQERYSLDVHHIVQRSNGGTNNNSNLIVLCPTHHQKSDRGEIPATRLKMIVSGSKHN